MVAVGVVVFCSGLSANLDVSHQVYRQLTPDGWSLGFSRSGRDEALLMTHFDQSIFDRQAYHDLFW